MNPAIVPAQLKPVGKVQFHARLRFRFVVQALQHAVNAMRSNRHVVFENGVLRQLRDDVGNPCAGSSQVLEDQSDGSRAVVRLLDLWDNDATAAFTAEHGTMFNPDYAPNGLIATEPERRD